jgi:hypothetical protein
MGLVRIDGSPVTRNHRDTRNHRVSQDERDCSLESCKKMTQQYLGDAVRLDSKTKHN